jgi:hypothetical protein
MQDFPLTSLRKSRSGQVEPEILSEPRNDSPTHLELARANGSHGLRRGEMIAHAARVLALDGLPTEKDCSVSVNGSV